MTRVLAFAIEPADAFVGVLRLKAVIEASRWPPELSQAFRAAAESEFRRVEDTVRTVGLCYADLEESGVAELNRAPQSRFDDVDGALHLCACGVSVALDLDHLRMAFDHGDRVARESATGLANSLRAALWYLVRTELFVCTRMTLGDREIPPERALEFTEQYLEAAWQDVPMADPPAPATASASGGAGVNTGSIHRNDLTPGGRTVVNRDLTAVYGHTVSQDEPAAPTLPPMDASREAPMNAAMNTPGGGRSGFASLSEDARYFLFQADIREQDWPVHRATLMAARRTVLRRLHPDTAGAHATEMYASAERGAAEVLQHLAAREAPGSDAGARVDAGATVQIRSTDLLSEDARYFLDQGGLVWPGDAPRLDAARAALAEVAAGDRARTERLDRGYLDLRRMAGG